MAKPTARILDLWLGPESIQFFSERDFEEVLRKHIESKDTDIEHTEGKGALNFLAIDDVLASAEGEPIDPRSLVSIQTTDGLPVFPEFSNSPSDPFLGQIQASGKKWVVLTHNDGEPHLVLDANAFLRAAVFRGAEINALSYCHRPIIVSDANMRLGEVIRQLV